MAKLDIIHLLDQKLWYDIREQLDHDLTYISVAYTLLHASDNHLMVSGEIAGEIDSIVASLL